MLKQQQVAGRAARRTEALRRHFDKGTPRARVKARREFAQLVRTRQAAAAHFHVMLKWCSSSDDMLAMIEGDMPRAGLAPAKLRWPVLEGPWSSSSEQWRLN